MNFILFIEENTQKKRGDQPLELEKFLLILFLMYVSLLRRGRRGGRGDRIIFYFIF